MALVGKKEGTSNRMKRQSWDANRSQIPLDGVGKCRYKQPQCALQLETRGAGESLRIGGRRDYCISGYGKKLCPSKASEWQSLKSHGKFCGLVGKLKHKLRQMYWTIVGLGKEVLMKKMTQGYLGIESSQCQVFFQAYLMLNLRVFISFWTLPITTVSPNT